CGGKGIGGRSSAPPRPLLVEVSHADFVVDGIVFAPAMQDVAWRRARPHADSLSGDSQEILMQVAPERSPDGVVVADALCLLVLAVALKAETAELDHDPVRAEGVIVSTRSDEARMLYVAPGNKSTIFQPLRGMPGNDRTRSAAP